MKLLGITDGVKIVASMGHHDYRNENGLMMDGGQPATTQYAGYHRWGGGRGVWFEVPEKFSELYQDYQFNWKSDRKYGVWNFDEVRILSVSEQPDIESIDTMAENAIWGTRGVNGDEPLRYVNLVDCDSEHLHNIATNQRISAELAKIIIHILFKRKNEQK